MQHLGVGRLLFGKNRFLRGFNAFWQHLRVGPTQCSKTEITPARGLPTPGIFPGGDNFLPEVSRLRRFLVVNKPPAALFLNTGIIVVVRIHRYSHSFYNGIFICTRPSGRNFLVFYALNIHLLTKNHSFNATTMILFFTFGCCIILQMYRNMDVVSQMAYC